MPKVSIVIVAAGIGKRMGQGDKLFLEVAGLPLVGHTWRRFDRFIDASELVVCLLYTSPSPRDRG